MYSTPEEKNTGLEKSLSNIDKRLDVRYTGKDGFAQKRPYTIEEVDSFGGTKKPVRVLAKAAGTD